MKHNKWRLFLLMAVMMGSLQAAAQQLDVKNIKSLRLKMIPVGGLEWKGEKTQNTNWNKISQAPDGRIWFAGGDHWGTDEVTGTWDKGDRYDRLWGFGNTVLSSYDPETDETTVALEFNRASSIYSNAETPGHGKSHSDIITDSKGRVYFAGYLGVRIRMNIRELIILKVMREEPLYGMIRPPTKS